MRNLLLLLLPLLASCEWNGVIQLEADSASDSSGTGVDTGTEDDTGTDRDSSTGDDLFDSDSPGDSTDTGETDHQDTTWNETDTYVNDLVVVPVVLPASLQGPPGNLCGFIFSGNGGPDFSSDVSHCIFRPPVTNQHTTMLFLPRFDLSGAHSVGVVLYVEGGAITGSPPVPGLDFYGQTAAPIELFEGMGVVNIEPIFLERR